jgi:hypothetical protein
LTEESQNPTTCDDNDSLGELAKAAVEGLEDENAFNLFDQMDISEENTRSPALNRSPKVEEGSSPQKPTQKGLSSPKESMKHVPHISKGAIDPLCREKKQCFKTSSVVTSKKRNFPRVKKTAASRESVNVSQVKQQPTLYKLRSRRKRPAIVITGIMNKGVLEKLVTKLGGILVQNMSDINECTHIVSDRIVRTEKFLCAIATAKYCVTSKWLEASGKANRFLPEKNFTLLDKPAEKKFSFSLVCFNVMIFRSSLTLFNLMSSMQKKSLAQRHSVFKGKLFFMVGDVNPPLHVFQNIIHAGKGRVTHKLPTKASKKTLIVARQLKKGYSRKVKQLKIRGFKVQSCEGIMMAALSRRFKQ